MIRKHPGYLLCCGEKIDYGHLWCKSLWIWPFHWSIVYPFWRSRQKWFNDPETADNKKFFKKRAVGDAPDV